MVVNQLITGDRRMTGVKQILILISVLVMLLSFSDVSLAGSYTVDPHVMANTINNSYEHPQVGGVVHKFNGMFTLLDRMINAGVYIAGIFFAIAAIFRFKEHRNNPSQIPISIPLALGVLAGALLFLPMLGNLTGYSLFGDPIFIAGAQGTPNIPT